MDNANYIFTVSLGFLREKTLRSLVLESPKPKAGIFPSTSKHSRVFPKISITFLFFILI